MNNRKKHATCSRQDKAITPRKLIELSQSGKESMRRDLRAAVKKLMQ